MVLFTVLSPSLLCWTYHLIVFWAESAASRNTNATEFRRNIASPFYLNIVSYCVFLYALVDLAANAQKGIISILKVACKLEDYNHFLLNFFDIQTQQGFVYSAEIWSLCANSNIIEKLRCFH